MEHEKAALPQEDSMQPDKNGSSDKEGDIQKIEQLKTELREKEEDYQKRFKELVERERSFFKKEMKSRAQAKLKKSNIPFEAIELVNMETEESMEKSIALIEKLLKRNTLHAPVIGEPKINPASYRQRAAAYIRNNF